MPTGIPFNPEKKDVLDALEKANGIVTNAAKEMGVHRHTLESFISEHEDVKEFLNKVRFSHDEKQLDIAENVIHYAMSLGQTDLASALKASFYFLNNKGKKRGYSHSAALSLQTDGTQSNIKEIAVQMKSAHDLITKED